jgi:hypothetical protein
MLLRMRAVGMVEDAGYTSVEAADADAAFARGLSQLAASYCIFSPARNVRLGQGLTPKFHIHRRTS